MHLMITGSTGLLGSTLLRQAALSHELQITAVSTSPRQTHPLLALERDNLAIIGNFDLSEQKGVLGLLDRIGPDLIIHCAALASPLACYKDPVGAWRANAESTANLAKGTRCSGGHMVYVSTDLVFEGADQHGAPFNENTAPCPISDYAKSKYSGEQSTLTLGAHGCVARVSLILGRSPGNSKGALGWMEESFLKEVPLTLFKDEYRTPIWTEDAARFLLFLATRRIGGLWHLGPRTEDRLSRWELGKLVALYLGYNEKLIVPTLQDEVSTPFPRPKDVSLDSSKFAHLFGSFAAPMHTVLSTLSRNTDSN